MGSAVDGESINVISIIFLWLREAETLPRVETAIGEDHLRSLTNNFFGQKEDLTL